MPESYTSQVFEDSGANFARDLDEQGVAIRDLSSDRTFTALCDQVIAETRPLHENGMNRVVDAWIESPAIRAMIGRPEILEPMAKAYRGKPFPIQTDTFQIGSRQPPHTDVIHHTPTPLHRLCNVWVALEDVSPDAGPLFYYPGSHKLPMMSLADAAPNEPDPTKAYTDYYEGTLLKTMEEQGFACRTAILKKGQVLFWAANLVHGGSQVLDPARTRRSLVVHYFFKGDRYSSEVRSPRRHKAMVPTDARSGRLVWSWRSIPSPLTAARAIRARRRRHVIVSHV